LTRSGRSCSWALYRWAPTQASTKHIERGVNPDIALAHVAALAPRPSTAKKSQKAAALSANPPASKDTVQRLWRWQPLRGTRGRGASSKAAMATARGEEILLPNISTFLAKSKSKSSLVCDLTPLWVGHVCIRG